MYSIQSTNRFGRKKTSLILRLCGYILSYIISLLAEVKTADKTKEQNRTEEDKMKGNEGTEETNKYKWTFLLAFHYL
jgi:hypothetical protein